jgi:hypothetical protein
MMIAALLCLAAGVVGAAPGDPAERVRLAALATYVHGMTDEIARSEVGSSGIPHLLDLLRDPQFPRRDNVVAFLAHLAGDEATPALLEHLQRAAALPTTPEENRARLLVPVALGRIAVRGGEVALDALHQMADSPDLPENLVRQARYGLDLAHGIMNAGAVADGEPSSRTIDPSTNGSESPLSYANHVDVTDPMTDAELDANLQFASVAAGFEDFDEDVACCIRVSRSGNARTFGSPGDGLDIIDSADELAQVFGGSPARVKVVEMINHCGEPGTNIVGCAELRGDDMAVVRVSSNEPLLWLHEYGHNVGLYHHDDPRYVMHGTLRSSARGLEFAECGAYHSPPSGAGMTTITLGACHDDDSDGYVSISDNCPDDANPGQADTDGDGQGDVCESCTDRDGDGFGSPPQPDCPQGLVADCDDTDEQVNPAAPEICDGRDNDCNGVTDDLTCDLFEATGDAIVDGFEVAWLGWSFGLCSSPPHDEWWLSVDYTGDGCVDGNDLAILASVYRCTGTGPACSSSF